MIRIHAALIAAVLPLAAAPLPLDGQAARKPRPRAAAPAPALRPSPAILPLPLNPVVPAAQRLCTDRTPSGVGYTMLRAAAGTKPAESDVVLVNYVGYLAATGVVFDQGMRAAFPVKGVIPGFSEGLRLVGRSGVARLCIPAALGYGATESGPIPANSDLVFQVELLDYKSQAEIDAMSKAQSAATPDAAPQAPTQP